MSQSPFPGMDPYLEASDIWRDVHTRLMTIFAEQLTPNLIPKYTAELETEVVIDQIFPEPTEEVPRIGVSDVTITQPDLGTLPGGVAAAILPAPLQLTVPMSVETRIVSIYIRQLESRKVITVIELLSPVNKRPGEGREKYLEKRAGYLDSRVHLVEIDLLRKYPRMPFGGPVPDTPYLAMVSRAGQRPLCDVWPIRLQDPLPVLPVPLQHPDPPVPLDMSQALRIAYQRARYDFRVDYSQPLEPPLSDEDRVWVTGWLEEQVAAR